MKVKQQRARELCFGDSRLRRVLNKAVKYGDVGQSEFWDTMLCMQCVRKQNPTMMEM